MRRCAAWVVASAIAVSGVSGCGRASSPPSAPVVGGELMAARQAYNPGELAAAFARSLEGTRLAVRVQGSRVVLPLYNDDEDELTYDFNTTPATGMVRVTARGYEVLVARSRLNVPAASAEGPQAEFLVTASLVPMALSVAFGGALGFATYCVRHPGDQFHRDEALKAAVAGMTAALVPFVSEVRYAQYLVPLAAAILQKARTLHYKDLAKAATGMLDDIIRVIGQMVGARVAG